MNGRVCIDASLALSWLLPRERNEATDTLILQWHAQGIKLITAPLFHAEVTSVLREQVYHKKLLPQEGEQAFVTFLQLAVETINEQAVYTLAWELAKKFNLPRAYDMQYLAVAELKDCEFWTNDRRLVNSLQDKVPRLKLAGDYRP
ncbi:MAG: type II toxin-antitoxin system VapC family toxin [Chloroflexi bacterium]|nr:type II toxin-antitoxin system VapC family toxin [Chloroflexota bacterium]